MAWHRNYKIPLLGLAGFALIVLTIVACTVDIDTAPTDMAGLSCEQMKREYDDGARFKPKADQGFLTELESETNGSLIGRVFLRLLIWNSGGREQAEADILKGYEIRMTALEKEIAARCS